MPKVKSEKRPADKEVGTEEASSEPPAKKGWGTGGALFGTETTETTFQGAGFKDKAKALETLALLDGRDITFQFQIINSMFHRARVILKRTKDAEKVRNLTEAVETFEKWLDDYKSHSRAKENFGYLPLEVVEAYRPLAARHGLKLAGKTDFLAVYSAAGGDLKKLRNARLDADDEKSVTWDVHRNVNVRAIDQRVKTEELPLYEVDAELKGLPSKAHVEMIMWGFSPEVAKVKKAVSLLPEKL